MAASVGESLWSRILESSPKFSKVPAVVKYYKKMSVLTLPVPFPDEKKNKLNFYFHTSLCKPFAVPQRSVKIKI